MIVGTEQNSLSLWGMFPLQRCGVRINRVKVIDCLSVMSFVGADKRIRKKVQGNK